MGEKERKGITCLKFLFSHDVFTLMYSPLTPLSFPSPPICMCIIIGTILGATEMVTGFPPSSLLMTSV